MWRRFLLMMLCFGFCSSAFPQDVTRSGIKSVAFTFQPVIGGVQKVFLAGSFNDWNDSRNLMIDPDGDGIVATTLMLVPGRYLYKFVVDGNWLTDPDAGETEPDGQGGQNAVLVVGDSLPEVRFERGDGLICTEEIPFRLDYDMVNPMEKGWIEFKTRCHRDDVEHVHLYYVVDSDSARIQDMDASGEDEAFTYFSTRIRVKKESSVWFSFQFADGPKTLYLTPGGFQEEPPLIDALFYYSPEILPRFVTPDWAKDGVFYQIFPERFRNGDPTNDPDFSEPCYAGHTGLPQSGQTNDEHFHLVKDWNDVSGLTQSPFRTDGKPDYYSFYGGDIEGVYQKLEYLKDLGITILYFNPLNAGKSNHKYDPMDYLKIDPHFADEATFQKFVKKAHKLGIRVIVDMAFNHTGDGHFAFLDTKERGDASPYWNWYEWREWPLPPEGCPTPCDYYDCWWGFPLHPNLNFDLSRPNAEENDITNIRDAVPNREVVKYILDVPRYWIGKLGIDGFRLDVPNEVPFWFWKQFRAVVDSVKSDAFLIGEIWGNAMPWLGPDCFHATMNYKYFRDPVLNFFALGNIDAAAFDRAISAGREIYPIQATQVMMNLIDSHDTERFLTLAGDDARRLKLAALFQMTYVGIPQIYYGDEVGLDGGKDPDNRRTFPWGWQSSRSRSDLHAFYRQLIQLRKKVPLLRQGNYETLLAEGKLYAYARQDKRNCCVVILNNEDKRRTVSLDLSRFRSKSWIELLTGKKYRVPKDGVLTLDLEPHSGMLLKK